MSDSEEDKQSSEKIAFLEKNLIFFIKKYSYLYDSTESEALKQEEIQDVIVSETSHRQ